jgi:hypothetical protein
MRRQRYVIKVEPDLPEPSTNPATLLLGATDGLFVKRRLLAGGIKVDYTKKSVLGGKHVIYTI